MNIGEIYQYDIELAGRWSVEKWKHMAVKLFEHVLFKPVSGFDIELVMHPDTASALILTEVVKTDLDQLQDDVVGTFWGIPIHLDSDLPPMSWKFEYTIQ